MHRGGDVYARLRQLVKLLDGFVSNERFQFDIIFLQDLTRLLCYFHYPRRTATDDQDGGFGF